MDPVKVLILKYAGYSVLMFYCPTVQLFYCSIIPTFNLSNALNNELD